MADPVKRQYRSPARAAAAAATRARIREAAQELFVRQGFVATTMRQVAAAAGVGERTVYDAFPTKAGLFGHTLAVATVGDEQPVRVADRPEIGAARHAADPREAVTRLVGYVVDLLDRAGDLIMVSVEAAGADPDMRVAADAGSRAHHEVMRTFAAALHQRGALRAGLDPMAAADILYALCSPHMHQLLRRHRGWASERYRTWLVDAVCRELLPETVCGGT
ncbi:helix-turn-helix domain-containing protein [Phytohabitans sp. ZYX-F-186]|uniref:Helix-turn-helix domain-containing protein n=1 Tax=Phytohabitans maris TaxID=3071409 RepID=A0ABU0ZBI8_9ACTN|nr:helix-turn-helix domain-containing protein [Phytohabitans sp. ZYX-F-186]MDQ7903677.1 helix-turn-helix domain-containing protein [Phytohabitans sp. ZYX-F-186]